VVRDDGVDDGDEDHGCNGAGDDADNADADGGVV